MYVVSTGGRTTGLARSFVEAHEDVCVPTLGPRGPPTADEPHAPHDEMISTLLYMLLPELGRNSLKSYSEKLGWKMTGGCRRLGYGDANSGVLWGI